MADNKWKVTVTLKAEVTYEVEIECDEESDAEEIAISQWREKTPDDFQVEKGYITDWETEAEQTAWACRECGKSIAQAEYNTYDEMCATCFNESEEK